MNEKRTILDKPYSDRQLVLFVNDDVVAAHEKAEALIVEDRKYSIAPDGYLEYFKSQLKKTDIDELARIVGVMRSFFVVKREGVNIRLVEKSQLPHLQIWPGHPRDNVVYIGHPALPKMYIPFAEFHSFVFEHKFSEAVSLLISLGAKAIHVKHIKGWKLDLLLQLNTRVSLSSDYDETKVKSLLDIYKTKAVNGILEHHEEQPKPAPEPVAVLHTALRDMPLEIPKGMVWYPFEPTWQWVSEGRLKFGLKEFILDINYKEDYDIHMALKTKLEKAGFNFGGEFEKHMPTMWRLFGEFWS